MTKTTPTTESTATGRMTKALEAVQKIDPDMPIQYLSALLFVASHPGCFQIDLVDKASLSTSAACRFVTAMGHQPAGRIKTVHRLLEKIESDEDRRYKALYLTPRGQEMVKKIAEALG